LLPEVTFADVKGKFVIVAEFFGALWVVFSPLGVESLQLW
jgi:hypothetical protein